MKRIATIFLVLAMLAMASAVQAGESWVFPDEKEAEIINAVKAAFPGRQVDVYFSENFWNGSLVDCRISHPLEFVQIFVHLSGCVSIRAVSRETRIKTAEKIKARVDAIFNRPASEELGRKHLK